MTIADLRTLMYMVSFSDGSNSIIRLVTDTTSNVMMNITKRKQDALMLTY